MSIILGDTASAPKQQLENAPTANDTTQKPKADAAVGKQGVIDDFLHYAGSHQNETLDKLTADFTKSEVKATGLDQKTIAAFISDYQSSVQSQQTNDASRASSSLSSDPSITDLQADAANISDADTRGKIQSLEQNIFAELGNKPVGTRPSSDNLQKLADAAQNAGTNLSDPQRNAILSYASSFGITPGQPAAPGSGATPTSSSAGPDDGNGAQLNVIAEADGSVRIGLPEGVSGSVKLAKDGKSVAVKTDAGTKSLSVPTGTVAHQNDDGTVSFTKDPKTHDKRILPLALAALVGVAAGATFGTGWNLYSRPDPYALPVPRVFDPGASASNSPTQIAQPANSASAASAAASPMATAAAASRQSNGITIVNFNAIQTSRAIAAPTTSIANNNTGGATHDYDLSTLTDDQAEQLTTQVLQPMIDTAQQWLDTHPENTPRRQAIAQQAGIYENIITGTEALTGSTSAGAPSHLIISTNAAGDVSGAALGTQYHGAFEVSFLAGNPASTLRVPGAPTPGGAAILDGVHDVAQRAGNGDLRLAPIEGALPFYRAHGFSAVADSGYSTVKDADYHFEPTGGFTKRSTDSAWDADVHGASSKPLPAGTAG